MLNDVNAEAAHGNEGRPLDPLTIPDYPNSKIFALVIGINKYKSHSVPNLEGAVPDANAIVEYLCDHLHVPINHITKLYDGDATRSNILKALKELASDTRIAKGDPIVIYYAGHGAELDAPESWLTNGQKIQSLVPSDEGTIDAFGETVSSIPDRTIGVLLDKLAESKGDNIMVVFDSCHSAGGTRGSNDVRARYVEPSDLTPLRLDTDNALLGARALAVPENQLHLGSRSHVFLAACGAKEVAKEPGGRGAFTKALLDVLYSVRPDNTTYMGIIDQLVAIPGQTPQCEGHNKTQVLFGAKVAGASHQFVRVLRTEAGYALQAGAAQGIQVGARFDVHKSHFLNARSNPPLASFIVQSVSACHSKLEPAGSTPDSLPTLLYARQTVGGTDCELKVYFTDAFVETMNQNVAGWKEELKVSQGTAEFRVVTKESEAGLVVGFDNNKVVYETRHKAVNASGLVRIPGTTETSIKEVLSVIWAAARWSWHVDRTNVQDPFKGKLKIEMRRVRSWDGGPLSPSGGNLNASGSVEVIADDEQMYGFRLVNESEHDLYPYLFYFDPSDLTIGGYYLGSHGGVAGCDAQLPGKGPGGTLPAGDLTLGYGPNNSDPLYMSLSNDQDRGVAILKLFVTTSPTDFTVLEQDSPFSKDGRAMKFAPRNLVKGDWWGTSMMVVSYGRKALEQPSFCH